MIRYSKIEMYALGYFFKHRPFRIRKESGENNLQDIIRKHGTMGSCLMQREAEINDLQGKIQHLEYLSFPNLDSLDCVRHLFTTRLGGVSGNIYSSMNLSFTRGDDPECVLENFRRVASVLGCETDDIVCSDQTHTTNIRRVTSRDRGKGVLRPRDYADVDGLVTNEPNLALATFYADCVPLYLADPEKKAIGLGHSGWKGTVDGMGALMVKRMECEFGSDPAQIQAAIGPSICQECYEVSGDVAERFSDMLADTAHIVREIKEKGAYPGILQTVSRGTRPGKYQLDLWLANLIILRKAGILLEHIAVTDICTCHNPGYLFSHRASQGKRGNLGAFLMLKKS